MNVLDKPMFDLKNGQFTEISSSKENPYSWPEYQGRSIMLVGSDYFILYDDVHDNNIGGRLSWFTHPLEDLPEIAVIRAGGLGTYSNNGKLDKTELSGKESKGVWYDGTGDFLTFVSHKKGYLATQTAYGGTVTSADGKKDYIFRNDLPVTVNEPGLVFSGTAGFIREKEMGKQQWALFHGTRIGNAFFEINTANDNAGIGAEWLGDGLVKGDYSGRDASEITFKWKNGIPADISFYVDGVKQPEKNTGSGLIVHIPSGKHIWNLTSSLPDLPRPEIAGTVNEKDKVLLKVKPVTGADGYQFEYSTDVGKSWITLAKQPGSSLSIKASGKEAKGYVRVMALNKDHESVPSVIYPVYFTKEKPHYPDGLHLEVITGTVRLSWGKVLGCEVYRLYRREKGSLKYQTIYSGWENQFSDDHVKTKTVYEYAVSAFNGNGESNTCIPINNDPENWLNFDPLPGERFRRSSNRLNGIIDAAGNGVNEYYPE